MWLLALAIWLFCGAIMGWKLYHSLLKDIYEEHKTSMFIIDKKKATILSMIVVLCCLLGGTAGLIISHWGSENRSFLVWWFTTTDKPRLTKEQYKAWINNDPDVFYDITPNY